MKFETRPLRFMAWDVEQNKMLTHEEIDQLDKDGVAHWMDIIKPDNKEGFIITQSTGLFDRNGVEIYDGDIIKLKWEGVDEFDFLIEHSLVSFSNGCFWNDDVLLKEVNESCEVIGNVFQNPELCTP